MIADRPDWCISRQRTWGVPIPLFVHKETGELHPRTAELIEQVASGSRSRASRPGSSWMPAELLGDEAAHYDKVQDTLDVWFDSGVTHCACCAGNDRAASLTLPGGPLSGGLGPAPRLVPVVAADSVRHARPRALRGVLTHGFTVDGQGREDVQVQGQRRSRRRR